MQTPTLADAGPVSIAYETFGSPDDPPLVLVMGLGTQMIAWPDGFCRLLADAGFHVVRFDNRDVGLSTHLDHLGRPDLAALLAGDPTSAPYLLADMAEDAVALLDVLGLDRVHLVGLSMGGMIAQEIAIRHGHRLLSLTSIMSTPAAHLGKPTPAAQQALLLPAPRTVEDAGDHAVGLYATIGSPGYPLDETFHRTVGEESFRRGRDPDGFVRHFAAIIASPDRRDDLASLRVPTLVLHGDADPLIQLEGGEETAAAVPGARLVVYPGMGHDLPEPLWSTLVDEITAHARSTITERT